MLGLKHENKSQEVMEKYEYHLTQQGATPLPNLFSIVTAVLVCAVTIIPVR
jgi:hypothetical protein